MVTGQKFVFIAIILMSQVDHVSSLTTSSSSSSSSGSTTSRNHNYRTQPITPTTTTTTALCLWGRRRRKRIERQRRRKEEDDKEEQPTTPEEDDIREQTTEPTGVLGDKAADNEVGVVAAATSASAPSYYYGDAIEIENENDCTRCCPRPPPLPPMQLPLRFLKAGKYDPIEGRKRYDETLRWRRDNRIDTILREPNFDFEYIKQYYPHYYHLKGWNGEPIYYELASRTNIRALKRGGVKLESLLRHYAMITEFQWQYLERSDDATSIYVIDLEGIRIRDFVGDTIKFVRSASRTAARHYPERAGYVLVVNVPRWFKIIWQVVRPIIDDSTLHKIYILRGKDEILKGLAERIPIENIPPEYGGRSRFKLGESPEEQLLADLISHNNALARGQQCNGCNGTKNPCKFCTWTPARSY